MQIAKGLYTLAQEQNDTLRLIGAYGALACTLYFLGDFETSGQYAMRGVQLWRSLGARSPVVETGCRRRHSSVLPGSIRMEYRRDRLLPRDHGGSYFISERVE